MIGTMRARTVLAVVAGAAALGGCGSGDDDAGGGGGGGGGETRERTAEPSPVLGTYVMTLKRSDDAKYLVNLGVHHLTLKEEGYETITPAGPGVSGPGRPDGAARFVFDADFRRDCSGPATYDVKLSGDVATFRPVGTDDCAVRLEQLTFKPWRRDPTP